MGIAEEVQSDMASEVVQMQARVVRRKTAAESGAAGQYYCAQRLAVMQQAGYAMPMLPCTKLVPSSTLLCIKSVPSFAIHMSIPIAHPILAYT